jgi:hypothetical protein
MKISIRFDCGNAAFDEDPTIETERILRELAVSVRRRGLGVGDSWPVVDVNGNTVGQVKVTR